MHKQRIAVEKFLQEFVNQLKTTLAQRVYAALSEAGVTDRQKAIKVLAIVNVALDEAYRNNARHFEKNVDELVGAASEVTNVASKSRVSK
jgi:hypothetical protein